jgi:hypothetical protein
VRHTNNSEDPAAGSWLDGFAIGASALCLVHCLALPLIFAVAPAATRLLGMPAWFHVAAFAVAVPASALAMLRGYRLHGVLLPVIFATLGLFLLGLGALAGFRLFLETGVTVAGSLILAAGHLRNWRLQRRAAGSCTGEKQCGCA